MMRHEESTLKIDCVDWFRYKYQRLTVFTIPSGGHFVTAMTMKREGILASDLFLAYPSQGIHGLWVDMNKFTTKIEARSYKEYLQEVDKKIKSKEDFYEGVFVSYMVQDTETAKEIITEITDENLQDILAKFVLHCGSLAVDCVGRCGKLIAIELTHEDYYYVLSDENGIWSESCIGTLNYIKPIE